MCSFGTPVPQWDADMAALRQAVASTGERDVTERDDGNHHIILVDGSVGDATRNILLPRVRPMRTGLMMRIIERYCRGKRNDQSLNEDGMLVTDDFAAVVDGVTSKKRAASVAASWRRDLMLGVIGGMPADASMRQMQRAVDECFQARYRSHEAGIRVFADEPVERLQVNAVVYSARRHEAWLFGDCQIMVNGVQTPTTKDVDVLLGDLRAFTVLALREMQDGTPDVPISGSFGAPASDAAPKDPSRAMILPFLRFAIAVREQTRAVRLLRVRRVHRHDVPHPHCARLSRR